MASSLVDAGAVDEPFRTFVSRHAQVLREFGTRDDSRADIIGVVDHAGRRLVLKHARDPESIGWLRSAVRFHTAVRHPAIAALVHHFETSDGFVLVEQWAPGEILVDAYDPAVPVRDDPRSAYQRLRSSPVPLVVDVLTQLFDAHRAVAAAGFVAVDLYDGCVLVDFDTGQLSLVDLDHYLPGPYVLDAERQIGSTTYMAPEELRRGATVDERSTVFTLGRMGLVYLGCDRRRPPERAHFRGNDERFEVLGRACSPEPRLRFRTVDALASAWASAGGAAPAASG